MNDDITQVCKRCGRLFKYQGFGHVYCSICKRHDDEDFGKVKDYIYEHGTATIMEVVTVTGVKKKYVTAYLREGRLVIPENSPIFIKCESCGCDIRCGRLCPDCAAKLSKGMKGVMLEVGEKPKAQSGMMRFLDKDNRQESRRTFANKKFNR